MKSTGHSNRAPPNCSATGGPDIGLIVLRTYRPAVRPPEPPIPVYFPRGRRLTGKQGTFVTKFALLIRNLRRLRRGETPLKLWVENLQPGMLVAPREGLGPRRRNDLPALPLWESMRAVGRAVRGQRRTRSRGSRVEKETPSPGSPRAASHPLPRGYRNERSSSWTFVDRG